MKTDTRYKTATLWRTSQVLTEIAPWNILGSGGLWATYFSKETCEMLARLHVIYTFGSGHLVVHFQPGGKSPSDVRKTRYYVRCEPKGPTLATPRVVFAICHDLVCSVFPLTVCGIRSPRMGQCCPDRGWSAFLKVVFAKYGTSGRSLRSRPGPR
jgi:hypothetical protein